MMVDDFGAAQLLLPASASPQQKSTGNQTAGSMPSGPPGGGATLLSSLYMMGKGRRIRQNVVDRGFSKIGYRKLPCTGWRLNLAMRDG